MTHIILVALAAVLTVRPAGASAPLPPADGCQASDHWDALASDGTEYLTADTFSPQAEASISQLWWSGTYLNDATECDPSGADAFEVTYFKDGGGIPGTVMAGPFRQSAGTLTVTGPAVTGNVLLDDIPEYSYHASHASVPVLAGECYWIAIRNPRNDGCVWYWAVGKAVDGMAIHERGGGRVEAAYDPLDMLSRDLAFCLDTPVEIPSYCGVPPNNDTCEARLTIREGSHPFTTIAATGYQPIALSESYTWCDMLLDDEVLHRDVWFDYVPPCSGMLRLDVCDADFDSKLIVYEQTGCPDPRYGSTPLTCNDDGCGHEPGDPAWDVCYGRDGLARSWSNSCADRVRNIDSECRGCPWPAYCDTLAAALCRKPTGTQSDIVAPVHEGRTYIISIGGYSRYPEYIVRDTPDCLARLCRADPGCCESPWEVACDWLALNICIGEAGSGTLNVELVALPPVQTNLRHFHDFLGCFSGSCAKPPCEPHVYPDPCCLNQDFDNDGDVDVADYATLRAALTGP